MRSRFIKLYDDNGYGYIVNIDKITFVNVDGRKVVFDESYCSLLIHNELGLGYAVCARCYEEELREMGESCDL